jgi:hypothetical protein
MPKSTTASRASRALNKARWSKATPEERRAHALMMVAAREKKLDKKQLPEVE